MEKLIVDRIEDGIAMLEMEDLSHISVSSDSFGVPVKEGDILLFDGVNYTVSEEETEDKKKKLLLMQQMLKKKSKNN